MDFNREAFRKSLHLTGLLIPLSYLLFGRELTLIFVSLAIVSFFIIEPYRISKDTAARIIEGIRPLLRREDAFQLVSKTIETIDARIKEIAREEEKMCIGAHIYFSISALLVLLFFPRNIALATISAATIGDALAAIIGIRWGFHRFRNGKSVEGSLAFLLSSLLVMLIFLSWPYALLGAILGSLSEFYNLPPNDNFSNQLVMALGIYLATLL